MTPTIIPNYHSNSKYILKLYWTSNYVAACNGIISNRIWTFEIRRCKNTFLNCLKMIKERENDDRCNNNNGKRYTFNFVFFLESNLASVSVSNNNNNSFRFVWESLMRPTFRDSHDESPGLPFWVTLLRPSILLSVTVTNRHYTDYENSSHLSFSNSINLGEKPRSKVILDYTHNSLEIHSFVKLYIVVFLNFPVQLSENTLYKLY